MRMDRIAPIFAVPDSCQTLRGPVLIYVALDRVNMGCGSVNMGCGGRVSPGFRSITAQLSL
jgi:hypothetical protein